MTQLDLLDHIKRLPEPQGETYVPKRDRKRLCAQGCRVKAVMDSGEWQTLSSISAITGDPEASISARLRSIRKAGFQIDREFVSKGLWRYRMVA